MLKHKYAIIAHADFTGLLGEFGKILDSDMFIRGTSIPITTLTTDRKLVKEEEDTILKTYREGFENFKINEIGKLIIDGIEYQGSEDIPLDQPEEINFLNL